MSKKVYTIYEIKRILVFEKAEIIENSKIDKEIKKAGIVVYEK